MLSVNFLDYVVFLGLVIFSMIVDHKLHKEDKMVSLGSAVKWSIFWVAISFIYAGFLWYHHNAETASLFVSGYLLEKVLSVDNLFVFSAIFAWFNIPEKYRHRVLYWGVIGAIVFRLIFVVIGANVLAWLGPYAEIIFAIMIGYAAFAMLKGGDDDNEEVDYENHIANKVVHKFFPVIPMLVGHKFFVTKEEGNKLLLDSGKTLEDREESKLVAKLKNKKGFGWFFKYYATTLLVCAAVIELSDVLFAFDSVPAVIAISKEPLIVYSAMLFAILGLRQLYFVLEALKDMLHHLEKAIIALLFFIAIKMLLAASLHLTGFGLDISPSVSLIIVLLVLAIGVIASFVDKKKETKTEEVKEEANQTIETSNNENLVDVNAAVETKVDENQTTETLKVEQNVENNTSSTETNHSSDEDDVSANS